MSAVHPVVSEAFRSLDDAQIRWALVRGADDLAHPSGDVDLLVDGAALGRLDGALEDAGLRRLGARGHGSHRFYFSHERTERQWIKLDVVTEVAFGPFQQFGTPLAAGLLERRRKDGELWRLAPDDEDWLFLLHLLLDKGGVAPDRREAACAAAGRVRAIGPVPETLDQLAGCETSRRVLDVAGRGDVRETRQLAAALRRAWTRRRPAAVTQAWLANRALRSLDVPAPGGPDGAVVALVGPDGAGKTTLSAALRRDFPVTSRAVYLGLWQAGRFDALLHRLPGGRLGQRATRALRGAAATRYHRSRGRLVVQDRSVHDLRLPGSGDPSLGGRLVAALLSALTPEPDLVVVLDAPGQVMFDRKGEHSVEVLEERRQAYLSLAAELPRVAVVDATLPPDEVARRTMAEVWSCFAADRTPQAGGRSR